MARSDLIIRRWTFDVRCEKTRLLIHCLAGPVQNCSGRSSVARGLIYCIQFSFRFIGEAHSTPVLLCDLCDSARDLFLF
jgi:hypothetical protein